ncbi:restriction endonuclease subunit S [Catenibacterium sp. AM22-6LB]|uniref:restriction endonuclease subunit S n=1 Tax=Catenibacterium sp. AM22-6LB TaxID=2292992 RepID=UPI000E3F789C|nr:restriction endonuclease subunit S [Catenibacterium sp. AM22-6LB]RGE99290.1 restriction endonuclease subunit S [Catenibacterium sp. AM22-6LB]
MSRCKLEEFISYEQPAKYIVDSDQYDDSYETPVLTAGKSFILGYTDEKNNIFDNLPVIIFDDFTTSVQFVDFPFKVKSSAMKLLKNTEQADIKYCYYLLKFLQHTPENHKRQWLSATSQNIVELPTIEKQKNIVMKLDKILEVIDNQNNQLELLDEAIKARFVEMFGDPNIEFKYSSVKFNDLVARMTKGPFGSDMKKDLFVPKGEDTYKVYIQINAIQKNQSLGEYYISKEYFDRKVSRFELFPNDYIITCDGTLGKYLKLDENMEKGVISPSLLRLTLQNDKINDKYFENIWDFYMLGLMKKEARNACLVHLPSAKKIGEISIPVPPLELQNQFASFVQEIDKSRLRELLAIKHIKLLLNDFGLLY